MSKTGILVHVYHLGATNWHEIIWGNSQSDQLGTMPKFVELLMSLPETTDIASVIYSGQSSKAGLTEGAYARQYLIDHFEELRTFPRFAKKFNSMSPAAITTLKQWVLELEIGDIIQNTTDEVLHAAKYFGHDFTTIYQVAAATHAPRCLQNQILVRSRGMINEDQRWIIVPSETFFTPGGIQDVVIIEPSHRGDDAMSTYRPMLGEVIKPYFGLSEDNKKQFIARVRRLLS